MKQTALSSEISAVIWGLLWFQATWIGTPVTVVYDATAAAGCANGDGRGDAEPVLSTVASTVACEVAATSPLAWRHVHSHTGHPWNEAVDAVATAVSKGIVYGSPPFVEWIAADVSDESGLRWAWTSTCDECYTNALPPVIDGRLQPYRFPCMLDEVPESTGDDPNAEDLLDVCLKLALANVNTLGEIPSQAPAEREPQGLEETGRAPCLRISSRRTRL